MATFVDIDCDVTGHRSIIDLVEDGTVAAYPCRSFAEAENVYWALYNGTIPMPSMIVVDTITRLTNVTRQDVVLDPSLKGAKTIDSLGEQAVTNKREYGITGDKVTRLLRNIFELPIPSIFIAHEGQRDDSMSGTEKVTANLQAMVLNNIVGTADAIIRLRPTPLPIEHNGLLYPPGSRQLLLAPTGDSAVGVRSHVPLPPFLMNPTLADLIGVFGDWRLFPHNTILFGPPKIGKTTFAFNADRRPH